MTNINRRAAVAGIASALVTASAAVAAQSSAPVRSELLELDAKLSVQIAEAREAGLAARPHWLACHRKTAAGETIHSEGPAWEAYVKASEVWSYRNQLASDTAGKMLAILPADFIEFAAVIRAYAYLNCEESLGNKYWADLFEEHAEFEVAQFAADLAKRQRVVNPEIGRLRLHGSRRFSRANND